MMTIARGLAAPAVLAVLAVVATACTASGSDLLEPPMEEPFVWEFDAGGVSDPLLPGVSDARLSDVTGTDDLVGLQVIEGDTVFVIDGDPASGRVTASSAGSDVIRVSVTAGGKPVGIVSVGDTGSTLAIDVDPAAEGYEYVRAPFWVGEAVFATTAGAYLEELLVSAGWRALCALPESRHDAPAVQQTFEIDCASADAAPAVAALHMSAHSAGVPASAHRLGVEGPVLYLGPCPVPQKDLETRIDELQHEAEAAFDLVHEDLIELLSHEEYWRDFLERVIETTTLIPPDGNVIKFVQNLASGNDGRFDTLVEAVKVAAAKEMLGKYVGTTVDKDDKDLLTLLDKVMSYASLASGNGDIQKASAFGTEVTGLMLAIYSSDPTGDRVNGRLQDWERERLEQITAELDAARDALERGEDSPEWLAEAYLRYDAAVEALWTNTRRVPPSGKLAHKCSPVSGLGGWPRAPGKGEPHLETFDGLHYDFQSAGEFVLLDSTRGDMEVHVRLVPPPSTRDATFAQALGVRLGDDVVQVAIEMGGILINDRPALIATGSNISLDGGTVARIERGIEITWPDGSEFLIGPRQVGLPFAMRLNPLRAGTMSGLFGDADGTSQGELRTAAGEHAEGELDPDWVHGVFADSWRITDEQSLLPYAPGRSTADYTDRTIPGEAADFDGLDPVQRDVAVDLCLTERVIVAPYLQNCVFDVALTGDPDFAGDAAIAHSEAVDVIELTRPLSRDATLALEPGAVIDELFGVRLDNDERIGAITRTRPADLYLLTLHPGEGIAVETREHIAWECTLGVQGIPLLARIIGPNGIPVTDFIDLRNNCARAALFVAAESGGAYAVQVGSAVQDGWTMWPRKRVRPYALRVSIVAVPQVFDAEVGDAVEPGSHGPGSGKIETVFAEDAYHVPLEAGQAMRVLLDDANGQCSNGPGPGLSLTVAFEDGRLVADSDGEPIEGVHLTNNCRNAHPRAQFIAPVSGTYLVKVRGDAIPSDAIWGESVVGSERTGEYRLRLEAG